MTIHPTPCTCGAFACEMRLNGGLQVMNRAGSVKHNRKSPSPHRYNAWERGIAGEHRPGGGFMPYFDKFGSVVGIKPASEQRHTINEIRAEQRSREVRS